MSLAERKIRPLEDRLVIRMLDPNEEITTNAGIIIPEGAHERTMFGVVVARGPGRVTHGGTLVGRDVEVNDVVLVGKLAGTNFTLEDGNEYLVIREADAMVRWEQAGLLYHLDEKGKKTGTPFFFKRAQLPAKVDTTGFYVVKKGTDLTIHGTLYLALEDVYVRERDGVISHLADGEERPGVGDHLVSINDKRHPNHPDHTLPRAAKGHTDENRDKLPRAAKGLDEDRAD